MEKDSSNSRKKRPVPLQLQPQGSESGVTADSYPANPGSTPGPATLPAPVVEFPEATATATGLQARLEVLESERQIEAESFAQLRVDLDAARGSNASLTSDKDALAAQLKEIEASNAALNLSLKEIQTRNAALESAAQDLEKRASLRAAQIVAETGTSAPANVTPKGEPQTASLLERFRSITDPTEQTAFWQGLSADQKNQILSSTK